MENRKGTKEKDWGERFSFLKAHSMESVYLTLLVLATSVADLRGLHLLLPENCRLPREQFNQLKGFWQKWVTAPTSRVSDELAQWVLQKQCADYGLTSWYDAIFNAERKDTPWNEMYREPFRRVWPYRADYEFLGIIFGLEMDIMFHYSQETEEMWVRLRFPKRALTEPLLYQLRQTNSWRWCANPDCDFTFAYYHLMGFEDGHLREDDYTSHIGRPHKALVPTESFNTYITVRLRDLHVDITTLKMHRPKHM